MKPKVYFIRELLPEEEAVVEDLVDYRMYTGQNITRDIVERETRNVDAVSTKIPSYLFLDEEILRNADRLKIMNKQLTVY